MKAMLFCLLTMVGLYAYGGTDSDTVRHVGFTVYGGPAWQIAMDEYERKWLRDKQQTVIGVELNYSAVPSDSDAFAMDYNYPTLSVGAKYSFNHGVTMRRTADPAWGKAQMVDYDSRLGNILSLYGSFSRPLLRRGRWQLDYTLRAGVGIGAHPYNKTDNIDNELLGSTLSIYFGAGITASYQLTDEWGLTGGFLYGHHSNGALARPNKGENHFGPFLGVRYAPYDKAIRQQPSATACPPFARYWYADLKVGVGGKTLLEDWQLTQFHTDPDDPDYRTDDFHFYMSYSAQAALMYRYARRWASGIGVDVYYGSYYKHVSALDESAGRQVSHSPWSIGISARHEVYYHQLSLDLAVGLYLHRQMGFSAKEVEQPYYEQVGVYYTFSRFGNVKLGASIQAHRTKADLTEVKVCIPFRLSKLR